MAAGCGDERSGQMADPPVPTAARPDTLPAPAMPGGTPAQSQAKAVRSGPFEKSFPGIHFSVPAGWQEVENPTPEFVDARFQIPTPHGDCRLTFSSNSGGVDLNIQRWIGQFQRPVGKRPATAEELSVDGKACKWIELSGDFVGGAMTGGSGGPAAGGPIERMLGVAIPLGSRDFYLKLTGSQAAVSDVRDAFRQFVRSARLTDQGG